MDEPFDILEYPELLSRVSDIIRAGGIAEIKMEKVGLTVVEQRRALAYPNEYWTPIVKRRNRSAGVMTTE